jgi:hypothetical protein
VGGAAASDFDKGRVTANGIGTAFINAAFGSMTTARAAQVTVTSSLGAPVKLVISAPGSSATIAQVTAGNMAQFTVTATFGNGSTRDVTEEAVWSMDDNPNVAVFADSNNHPGQVVGVGRGSVKISAVFGNVTSAAMTVTVP